MWVKWLPNKSLNQKKNYINQKWVILIDTIMKTMKIINMPIHPKDFRIISLFKKNKEAIDIDSL